MLLQAPRWRPPLASTAGALHRGSGGQQVSWSLDAALGGVYRSPQWRFSHRLPLSLAPTNANTQ
eukprot:scaffold41375_cov33-Tisochrysis_lutea.AAC.1